MPQLSQSAGTPPPLLPLFAGVGLALAVGSFEGAAVLGILPYIGGGLATSSDHALWTLTYFIVHWSLGITVMPWGMRRWGARRLYEMSIALTFVGTLLGAATGNLWIMLVARAMQGFGAGLLVPLSQHLFLERSPKARHGVVTIVWSNAMLIPFFAGPALGGYLAVAHNWRDVFWLSLPLLVIAAWWGRRGIPDADTTTSTPVPPFDLAGFGLLYAGLLCLQMVMDQGQDEGWWHASRIDVMSLAAFILLSGFAWREARCAHPLLEFRFFKRRNYVLGLLLLCLGWSLFMAWAALLPLWAENDLGYNGYWGSALLLPIALGAVPVGSAMDRLRGLIGLRRLAALCFLLFACAYGMAYVSPATGPGGLFMPMLVQGVAVGTLFVPLTLIVLSGIEPEDIPSAATTSNFIRVFSANVGVTLLSVYWIRQSDVAASALRAATPAVADQPAAHGLAALYRAMQTQAQTLSLDNLLRLSAWLCLGAAALAYLVLKPPSSSAAVRGPRSYVQEEEMAAGVAVGNACPKPASRSRTSGLESVGHEVAQPIDGAMELRHAGGVGEADMLCGAESAEVVAGRDRDACFLKQAR